MDRVTGRLERDVEALRQQAQENHRIAMQAAAEIAAHKDGCILAAERTQEKIEGVDRKVDGLRQDIVDRRQEDAIWRRDRQEMVDRTTNEWRGHIDTRLAAQEQWNRRVGIAVVVSAIAIVGSIMGLAAKPFVGPAVDAVKTLSR